MKKLISRKILETNLLITLLLLSLLLSACGQGQQGNNDINNSLSNAIAQIATPSSIEFKQYDGKLLINWSLVNGASQSLCFYKIKY